MNKTHHRYRTLSVVAAAVGAAALVTSCSGTFDKFDDSKAYKKTETFSFARTSNGIDTLPSWVPAGATDIDEIIRTTGNERILRMKANVAEIDHNICTALPTVETRPASLSAQWWRRESKEQLVPVRRLVRRRKGLVRLRVPTGISRLHHRSARQEVAPSQRRRPSNLLG